MYLILTCTQNKGDPEIYNSEICSKSWIVKKNIAAKNYRWKNKSQLLLLTYWNCKKIAWTNCDPTTKGFILPPPPILAYDVSTFEFCLKLYFLFFLLITCF